MKYMIVIGTGYLTNFSINVINGEKEYFAQIREYPINLYFFDELASAERVAKHFGGNVVKVKDNSDKSV